MRSYCARNSDSSFHNDRNEYGFRADTSHYSYFLRLTPNKGDYNELLRIRDGDRIRIITKGGEYREMTCRYVDEYHFEASSIQGDNLYHIAEFAERQEASGCQSIVPLRKSLPDRCFSFLESGILPRFASCSGGVQWFRERSLWRSGSYQPQPGNIIFFDWADEVQDGCPDHVGIVERVEDGIVYTIEGNSGDACKAKSYSIAHSEILGYGTYTG